MACAAARWLGRIGDRVWARTAGQFAARFCEIAGARRVFAVDVAENRLAMLPRSPAIVPVEPSDTDIRALVRDHNHGRLVEVAFE